MDPVSTVSRLDLDSKPMLNISLLADRPKCNMEDHLCSRLRPKAEEICCFKVTF